MCDQWARDLSRRGLLQGVMTTAVAAAVASGFAFADDPGVRSQSESWPSFRNGPDNRGVAASLIPPSPALLWERETTDGCKSTPAILGGRVYVGQLSGELQSLHLATGEVEWTYKSREAADPKTFIPGFNGPVTVTREVVLCGDEDGTLHCVDRQTGALRWTFDTEGLIVGGATVVGDRVVCGSHSQFLYGVDLRSGEKLWEFDAGGPINGTQAFDGDFTFVTGCSEPVLYVVDTRTGAEHVRVALDDLLIATPALVDGILYFGTSEGMVLAIDWRQLKTVAKFETRQPREVHSAPAVTNDAVIIGARDKSVYCLDRQTLQPKWTFSTRAGNDSSPVVVGDRVYIGSGDKFLYELSLDGGTEQWKHNAGRPFSDSSPAVGEGRMVVCTEGPQGKVLCFGDAAGAP